MSVVEVNGPAPYEVRIGSGVMAGLEQLAVGSRVALIHPASVSHLAARVTELVGEVVDIEVPDAEAAKTPEVLAGCWDRLAEAGLGRGDVVVGLGGGATTDLTGFVAATWMRGVRLIQVPTTVLGMADAAVGGKTGINIDAGKNLVGAFHEPAAVLCDTDSLDGLPVREVRSGMAEIVKCGFINDPVILNVIEKDPVRALDTASDEFFDVLTRAVRVKASVVSADPTESTSRGSEVGRERLNYGHTLAHAIEAHQHFTWRHGEADAVGMVFAAELSAREIGRSGDTVQRTRSVMAALGLPTTFDATPWPELRATMNLDKKVRRGVLRFVGLRAPGHVQMIEGPDEDVLQECFATLRPARQNS
ncbi:3-dehydroquinate synthase [Acidipropionibacterium virtanenii]|uniref:3-dehydroquinate synthase n=1 Tax=Acidipropionibacterium virtanenii TaxID=2057246 RepID=A0A344UU52_9ACTN|nr:3-dehydroquinate synthase [Acidipropionibacterium virtanenii]AXE38800.1 3-dehydroquinate synthase [Acidipropionibacterium virtanenii]